jgi:hypothetical protein
VITLRYLHLQPVKCLYFQVQSVAMRSELSVPTTGVFDKWSKRLHYTGKHVRGVRMQQLCYSLALCHIYRQSFRNRQVANIIPVTWQASTSDQMFARYASRYKLQKQYGHLAMCEPWDCKTTRVSDLIMRSRVEDVRAVVTQTALSETYLVFVL